MEGLYRRSIPAAWLQETQSLGRKEWFVQRSVLTADGLDLEGGGGGTSGVVALSIGPYVGL